MAWDDISSWTRGDGIAPPHVKESWEHPDYGTYPSDGSDDNPYAWDSRTGTWIFQPSAPPDESS